MLKLTKAQQLALYDVYKRGPVYDKFDPAQLFPMSFLAFRRRVYPLPCDDCIMVPWHNMVLGIEVDGHTHS